MPPPCYFWRLLEKSGWKWGKYRNLRSLEISAAVTVSE